MKKHFSFPSSRTRKALDPLFFGLITVKVSFCPRKLQDTISEGQVSCLCRGLTAKSSGRDWVQLGTDTYPVSGLPYWSKSPLSSHSAWDGSQSMMSKHSWTECLWDKALLSFRNALVTRGHSVVPRTRLKKNLLKYTQCWFRSPAPPRLSTHLPFLSCNSC